MSTIILDTRLPEDLDEATAATASDWLTIQKSGETALRKIRPANAVPNLSATKITSDVFDIARIPGVTLSMSLPATGGSLTGTFQTFAELIMPVTAASEWILVLAETELVVSRPNGTGSLGGTMRVLRNGSSIINESYVCYADGGSGSITIPAGSIGAGYPTTAKTYTASFGSFSVGGGRCVAARQTGLAAGNYTFSVQARYVGTANYGVFNNGRITVMRFAK